MTSGPPTGLIGDWLAVTPPAKVWAEHRSLCAASAGFPVLLAAAWLHSGGAPGDTRRLRIAFIASSVAGACHDLFLGWLPGSETSWQARGVLMLTPRVDAYTPCMYCCLLYCSYAAASRLFRVAERAPCAEAGAAGVLAALLYVPYAHCAAALLWTTWHDDDFNVRSRIYGVPCGSICWALLFSASFTGILRVAESFRWGAVASVAATSLVHPITAVLVFTAQVLSMEVFRGAGDARGSPGRSTLALVAFVVFMPLYRCLRRHGIISKGLRDLLGAIFNWIIEKIWPSSESEKKRQKRIASRKAQQAQQERLVDEEPDIDSGSVVVVSKPIRSRYDKEISLGTRGTVDKIYPKDGDALILLEGLGKIVIQKGDFKGLKVEQKVCPRCAGRGHGSWWTCKLCRGAGMLDVGKPLCSDPLFLRIAVPAYFLLLMATIGLSPPEAQVSTGLHQGWGSCEASDRDVLLRWRRQFACAEHFQRAHFSIECPGGVPPVPDSQWYTICGLPYTAPERRTGYLGYVLAVSVTSFCGIVAYTFAFIL